MILGLVFIPLHAHVAVDRVKTLRHCTTAVDVGFFRDDDPHVAAPVPSLVGGTRAAHTAAHDQNVAFVKNGLEAH